MTRRTMRLPLLLSLPFALLAPVLQPSDPALAADIPALYRAEAIVTGREVPEEHRRGLREAIQEVAVRLTGDPGLEGSGRIAPLLALAPVFVERYEYEDRMKDIPVHDEQGTRERPHFLRVAFVPTLIDKALAALDLAVWPEPRPVLGVRVEVIAPQARYIVVAQGRQGEGQREVVLALGRKRGLPVVLADAAGQFGPGLGAALDARLIQGVDGYWTIDWTVETGPAHRTGRAGPLSYDRALRAAFDDAVRLLHSGTP